MAVTAATDPRNENTCISRVRPGVANWWTAVRTNASNCCVSPSSISSASHPKTNKAAVAIKREPRSKNALFTFFDLSMWLDLGRQRNITRSKLIGRSILDSPEKRTCGRGCYFAFIAICCWFERKGGSRNSRQEFTFRFNGGDQRAAASSFSASHSKLWRSSLFPWIGFFTPKPR